MSKHTDGPWICDCSDSDSDEWDVWGGGNGHYMVATVHNGNGYSQNKANARLIAAAPLLLEAASLGHDDSPGLPCGDLLAAANVLRNLKMGDLAERLDAKHEAERAAIAAARGEA